MRANDNEPHPQVLEEAADWVDRLGELTGPERRQLDAWLAASPVHAVAFNRMHRMLSDPALIAAADQAAPAAPIPLRPAPRPARRGFTLSHGLIAASLVGLIAVGASLTARPPASGLSEAPLVLATEIGARSDYGLSDRSVVHLNADSRLSVRYSPAVRDLTLEKGDAMFDVAKNHDRPFVVTAGATTVTAVGTSFEVDRVGEATEVHVFEGVVRVASRDAPARVVRRGEWLLVSDTRQSAGLFVPDAAQTWRSDWLVAEQTPLKFVLARLNRYSPDQIVVRDAALGELKVTGRFRLSRPSDALAMISALLGVEASRGGQHIYLAPHRAGVKPV